MLSGKCLNLYIKFSLNLFFSGREVWVTNLINGETRVARIMDTCPECQFGSLDMSPSLFKSMCFDNLGFGRVGIMWGFCDREHGC